MRFAVLDTTETTVVNVVVGREDQFAELQRNLGHKLIDAAPLGLQVGDLFNGASWTRNVDGEQVALPLEGNPDVTEIMDIIEGGE